jgi:hypothetical protein
MVAAVVLLVTHQSFAYRVQDSPLLQSPSVVQSWFPLVLLLQILLLQLQLELLEQQSE